MENKIIDKIIENYDSLKQSIISDLSMKNESGHGLSTGNYREEVWSNLFRRVLPKKFSIVRNSFIIGSCGNTSPEIDIIIYDENYVPYIFQYGDTVKLIPIEAVIAVVQCKSENTNRKVKGKYILDEWVKKVQKIESKHENAYAYTLSGLVGNRERKTRPIMILCAMKEIVSENPAKVKFDVEIIVKNEKMEVKSKWEKSTFVEIAKEFNGVINQEEKEEILFDEISEIENPILKLSLLLNQMFMLINNPMIFGHKNYAKMFIKKSE